MKNNKRLLITFIIVTVIAVLIDGYIIMHSCFNANLSSSSSGRAVAILKTIINFFHKNTINESNIGVFTHVVRKLIGHFGFFLIAGIFNTWSIYLGQKDYRLFNYTLFIFGTLTFGFLLASFTEFIQMFVPGRSGETKDALIDFSGYSIGATIIYVITLIITKKNRKNI